MKLRSFSHGSFTAYLDESFKVIRERFLKLEELREAVVNFDRLTEKEMSIHEAHKDAVKEWKFTYRDPFNNHMFFTRYKLQLDNKCCGQGCRHCPYNMDNVGDNVRKYMKFNSSFWVDTSDTAKKVEAVSKQIFIRGKKNKKTQNTK